MFPGSFRGVLTFKDVSRNFQGCFKGALRAFNSVLRKFQWHVEEVSGAF